MQGILQPNLTLERVADRKESSLGRKNGILSRLFGCRHLDLSRPFKDSRGSYRACTACGARKRFDTESFKTLGNFYYPPSAPLSR
jgi:hypothetical protein